MPDGTGQWSEAGNNWAFWDEYIQYVLEWMLGKPEEA